MSQPYDSPNRGGDASSILRLIVGVIQLFVVAIALILGAAFILSLLGANPEAGFAQWIYGRSESLMTPFNGLFDPVELTSNSEFNLSLLFAVVVYVVIGGVLSAIARRF